MEGVYFVPEDKGCEFLLVKNSYSEIYTNLETTKSIKETAKKIINSESLFHFFLDGSRWTYKIDLISISVG